MENAGTYLRIIYFNGDQDDLPPFLFERVSEAMKRYALSEKDTVITCETISGNPIAFFASGIVSIGVSAPENRERTHERDAALKKEIEDYKSRFKQTWED